MPMALFSSSLSTFTPNPHLFPHKPSPPPPSSSSSLVSPLSKKTLFLKSHIRATENGAGPVGPAAVVVEEKLDKEEAPPASTPPVVGEVKGEALESANGAAAALGAPLFKDPRWAGGTWDLSQFLKDGKTNWDAVIDAEVRRRKWLEDNPESTTNEAPIVFDTSIIPWWAWVKRFHLPEAELLNGRAAMVGFFMAYFVDSLTGVGLVDQMGNFFCKTLLFVAVAGVLLIRKNEDIQNLKKLIDETTFYDKQWQATWQDDNTDGTKKD